MPKNSKEKSTVKVRIEQLSFEVNGTYMDIVAHTDYIDITIGGVENEKFSVELKEWLEINKQIVKLLKQG
jgi:hypothetical protein